jgi:cyclohexanecarboxylate-CoA ligase
VKPPLRSRLTPETTRRWRSSGDWLGVRFAEALDRAVAGAPGKIAAVDDRSRLTYAELDELTTRAAAALASRGVGAGDVVAAVLPNRIEFLAFFYAASRLGAVLTPIVPIYGAREIRFILGQTGASAVVVPEIFRGVEFGAMVERLRSELPALAPPIVLRDGEPLAAPAEPIRRTGVTRDASTVSAILYTSGTTADPKGVLHSDDTLLSLAARTARQHGLGDGEVFVIASPVAHISGLLYGVMLPVFLGATTVLMERWDPTRFLELVERERGTFSVGATPFLQAIVDHPELERHDLRSLRVFPCGGADVPPDLIRRAIARLGIRTGRGYGSTELPTITSSSGPETPPEKRAETDGRPVPPNEIELRDDAGRAVPPGAEGEVWARGPALCLGYRDAALEAEAFDARGFFRTGDLGVVDADGYLAVTGRVKDIIVRAGEKFSAKEIEDLLFAHPKVARVAIVPVPDPATGERACAFVEPRDAADPPTLAELADFLLRRELSRRKLPERLEIVADMPTTAAGKIQKQILKERVARSARGERG